MQNKTLLLNFKYHIDVGIPYLDMKNCYISWQVFENNIYLVVGEYLVYFPYETNPPDNLKK